jgi:small GTP-binding protein
LLLSLNNNNSSFFIFLLTSELFSPSSSINFHNQGSGKSALFLRLTEDTFIHSSGHIGKSFTQITQTYPHSMNKLFSTHPKLFRSSHKGVTVNGQPVNAGNDSKIVFEIWDMISNERIYPEVVRMPFVSASCVIMIFDVNNQDSFDNLDLWIKQMYKHAKDLHTVIIVGTKIDLEDERCVSSYDAEMFAKSHGFGYIEVSSKTGEGIEGILKAFGESLLLGDPILGEPVKEMNSHVDVDCEDKIVEGNSRCF